MRSFRDDEGSEWDVTIGRESWGALVLLFSPRAGGAVRKTLLPSETKLDAEQLLTDLPDDELRERLAASQPWEG